MYIHVYKYIKSNSISYTHLLFGGLFYQTKIDPMIRRGVLKPGKESRYKLQEPSGNGEKNPIKNGRE